jgi:hypothetical protein
VLRRTIFVLQRYLTDAPTCRPRAGWSWWAGVLSVCNKSKGDTITAFAWGIGIVELRPDISGSDRSANREIRFDCGRAM